MTWLLWSLVPGGIGFVLFSYGRAQQRWPLMAGGLAFMVYPYFTPGLPSMALVGLALGLGVTALVRKGY